MEVELFDWSVVVVGYWNPAILTPGGIAKRLFGLPSETPVLVEIPMDGLAPHRVRHEGMTVMATPSRLAVVAETPTLGNLERARHIASKAIETLPETPLTSAGFNIRLKLDDPPERLLTCTAAGLDTSLSDAGFIIKARNIHRSLEHEVGTLNLNVQESENAETKLEFNFHLESSETKRLCEWLKMPSETIEDNVRRILDSVAGISFQEDWK